MVGAQYGKFRNKKNNMLLHRIDLEISMIGAYIVANLEIKSTTVHQIDLKMSMLELCK